MTWEFYPATTMFSAYAEEWDRLNAQLYDSHPLFDSRFVGPLLDCFGSGNEKLCICRVNGVIEGALILLPSGAGRWASFSPSQAQISAILVADASLLKELLKTLPGIVWVIEFFRIDPRYSPDFSRLKLETKISSHSYTIKIDSGVSFAGYWNQRSKNLKANIRRYLNRARKAGCVSAFSEITALTEIKVGVYRYGDLESAGWKGAAGTAISRENSQGAFYAEVLDRFALRNQAAVCELFIDEQLAASRLVISNRHMAVVLKTTYDESLAGFAPGRLLLYRMLERHLDHQPEIDIEFYTNATPEQIAWSTSGCYVQNIQIFRSKFIAAAFVFLKEITEPLRSKVRTP